MSISERNDKSNDAASPNSAIRGCQLKIGLSTRDHAPKS